MARLTTNQTGIDNGSQENSSNKEMFEHGKIVRLSGSVRQEWDVEDLSF